MDLGYGVKAYRLFRDLTQEELAKGAGLDQGYVSKVENRRRTRMSPDKVVRLARALGVTVEELLDPPADVRAAMDERAAA